MPDLGSFLSSIEVRWFLEGWAEENRRLAVPDGRSAHPGPPDAPEGQRPKEDSLGTLHRWFSTIDPYGGREGDPDPAWEDWRTDVYLLLPTAVDMGIKWREEQLQIKGRVASSGIHRFARGSEGRVGSWVKWSYPGMPEAYRAIFEGEPGRELLRLSVRKRRWIRKVRIDPGTSADAEAPPADAEAPSQAAEARSEAAEAPSADAEPPSEAAEAPSRAVEVPADAVVPRGVTVELTNLIVEGEPYCSLGFEAFPDDAGMKADFLNVADAFLGQLEGVPLKASNSFSYPAWLDRLATR